VLAAVAERLVAINQLQQSVRIVRKLSGQLTVDDVSGGDGDATAGGVGTRQGQQQQGQQQQGHQQQGHQQQGQQQQGHQRPKRDLPARASLVVHEIFGTDPLSEHVLPALRGVQVGEAHG
jgi:hypothetical protein